MTSLIPSTASDRWVWRPGNESMTTCIQVDGSLLFEYTDPYVQYMWMIYSLQL